MAKVDGPSVFWKYSLWGKRRAFTEGAETLSKRLAEETNGKFKLKIFNFLKISFIITLITFVLLIFISCSKEDISLFYDQVEGKVFVRVDLLESSNKSIDQVDPSEYAFVKNFSPDKGHTVMYFVDNTETCTIFNAWYEMNILKHTSELAEADVKYGKIYDLKDHKVKYEIIQKNPLRVTYNLANGTQIIAQEIDKEIFYKAKDSWLYKSRNTIDTTFSKCSNLDLD